MADTGTGMVEFLGVAPDRRLLDEDLSNLPEAEQRREPELSTRAHNRLLAAGSLMTGSTLVGGGAGTIYAAWELLFRGGGLADGVLLAIALLLVVTHWGWVHVAEYLGHTIDERRLGAVEHRRSDWLAGIQPYPRFSVSTSVLDDASLRVQRVLHRPVLTSRNTFTFRRETYDERIYDAHASAEVIADAVETMRRQARLETDRVRELWEATSHAYEAASRNAHDEHQLLLARRAAATALSEHLNASLLEPPLVE